MQFNKLIGDHLCALRAALRIALSCCGSDAMISACRFRLQRHRARVER